MTYKEKDFFYDSSAGSKFNPGRRRALKLFLLGLGGGATAYITSSLFGNPKQDNTQRSLIETFRVQGDTSNFVFSVEPQVSPVKFPWSQKIKPVNDWSDEGQYLNYADWKTMRAASCAGGALTADHNAKGDKRIIEWYLKLLEGPGFWDEYNGMKSDGIHPFRNGYYGYNLVAENTGFTFYWFDRINLLKAVNLGNDGLTIITGVTGSAVNSDGLGVSFPGGHIMVMRGGKIDNGIIKGVYTVDSNPYSHCTGFTWNQWVNGLQSPNNKFWDEWALITVPKNWGPKVEDRIKKEFLK